MKKNWIYRSSLILTFGASLAAVVHTWLRIANISGALDVFDRVDQALLGFLILFTLGTAWGLIQSWLKKELPGFASRFLQNRRLYWGVLIFLGLILLESVQDLLYLGAGLKEVYYPVTLVRNRPLLIWAAFVSGQSILAWLILGWNEGIIKPSRLREIPTWLVLGLILGGGILALGEGGSLPANAPLPALHVLLIVGGLVGSGILLRRLSQRFPWLGDILRWEILALMILWAAAFTLWSNVPLQANYFLDGPRPPNQQFTPISDSIYYEIQAHRLLAGEGMVENVQHPLYILLLGGLHAAGGDHFLDIYRLQIALLAFTPFVLYKLGKLMHSKFAGWMVGFLFIVREYNALQLGDSITVSNVQVLMTEPTALLCVALFLYLTVLWLKEKEQDLGLPFLIGGVIGLAALVRVELLSMGLVFGLLLVIRHRRQWRRWLVPGMIALGALLLTMGPWLIRNYQKTGVLSIEKTDVIQKRFIDVGRTTNSSQDVENEVQNQVTLTNKLKPAYKKFSRMTYSVGSSLKQTLIYYPSNHFPLGGADTFVNIVPEKKQIYFFQKGIFSDTYLTRYTKSLPYWELRWRGDLAARSVVPLLGSLIVIVIGFREAWKKQRWLGMVPVLVMLGHISTYGLIRYAGGRFIQVVDWITMLYFSLGVAGLLIKGNILVQNENPEDSYSERSIFSLQSSPAGVIGVLVILVGISIPAVESGIKKQYSMQNLEEALTRVSQIETDGEILFGKVLYPGYYAVDETFVDDRSGRMPDPGRDQLVFYLVGNKNIWISLPVGQDIPDLRHGQEVVLTGKLIQSHLENFQLRKFPYFQAENFFRLIDNRTLQ